MTNDNRTDEEIKAEARGGRNLVILGIASIVISVITTVASLLIYHNSGDIYIDRSRPGFLPDKSENENKPDNYTFSDSGNITSKDLEEYLKHLDKTIKSANNIEDPFSSDPLTDESLGIKPSERK